MDSPSGSAAYTLPSPGSSQQEVGSPLSMGGSISHLPEDVLLEIFSWVPCKDLILTCWLVCLQWRELVDSTVLWKHKIERSEKNKLKNASLTTFHQPDDYYIVGRLERNLIKNPCGEEGMDFWEIGTPSENQWEIQTISKKEFLRNACFYNSELASNKCFNASNGLCIKSQCITLKDHSYWEDLMDTARPNIVMKDIFCSPGNKYQLTVKLLSADNQVLKEYCSQKKIYPWGYGIWWELSHTFYGCPPGIRHILFRHQLGVMDGSDPKDYTKVTRSNITLVSRGEYDDDDDFDDDSYDDDYDKSSNEYYDSDFSYFLGHDCSDDWY